MLNISQLFNIKDVNSSIKNVEETAIFPTQMINASYRVIYVLFLGSAIMIGVTGCGQKGELYLTDTSSQTVASSSDRVDSEVLNSTSHPQDAAFADIDDDDYQKTRYLEQKQVLPGVNDDPNDY